MSDLTPAERVLRDQAWERYWAGMTTLTWRSHRADFDAGWNERGEFEARVESESHAEGLVTTLQDRIRVLEGALGELLRVALQAAERSDVVTTSDAGANSDAGKSISRCPTTISEVARQGGPPKQCVLAEGHDCVHTFADFERKLGSNRG